MKIGTLFSFTGEVPDGCLRCDGSVYNIKDYKELAYELRHFNAKVGGGDGVTTFAVPNIADNIAIAARNDTVIMYWPGATVRKKDGSTDKQYTYDGFTDFKKALECFKTWHNCYCFDIEEAWIDITDGKSNNIGKIEIVNTWMPKVEYDKFLEELNFDTIISKW